MNNNIDFKSLRFSGVKKESPDEMYSSFFADIYELAKSIIYSIVNCNKEDLDFNLPLKINEAQNNINNVIAFIGRRGTGKTSAMLSVAEYFVAKGKNDINKAFYALPYTDVSVFEENEDVFIITLSKMFAYLTTKFENSDNLLYPEKHEIYKNIRDKICTVYDHYVSFKGKETQRMNSSYNLMEKAQNRYNVHNEFEELVKDYIQLLNTSFAQNTTEGYLIICLDDIDMTRYNHINIMQCIHQFFMIPNVIVMVTMRLPIMSAALQKEFFSSLHTVSLTDESNIRLSREQQKDYLRKIIPSGMRITMPSWKKRDYQTTKPIKLVLKKEDSKIIWESFPELNSSKLFDNYQYKVNQGKDYYISPKELIMTLLSDRTEIYLDAKGRKYHFMEPDSLRGLYDLYYLMHSMDSLKDICIDRKDDDEEEKEKYLKSNRKIILDYLHFKMLPEGNYDGDIRDYIKTLLEEPVDRRGEKIWNYFFRCLNSDVEKQHIISLFGTSIFKREAAKYKKENYCMGEVYRTLYLSTRLGLTKMNRDLVIFILASFSFTLPQILKEELSKSSNQESGLSYSESLLCNLFGYSLIGEWRKDLFNGSEVDIVVGCEDFLSLFSANKRSNAAPNDIDDFLKKFLYLLLLSSKSPNEIIEVKTKRYNYTRNDNEPLHYHFEINADPTSFIINSLDIDNRIDNMKFKFEGGIICIGVAALFNAIIHKDVKSKKLKYTLEEKIEKIKGNIQKELQNEGCDLQFLLSQTDLSYNVIKRSITKMLYVGANNLNAQKQVAETPLEAITSFYNNMEYFLGRQDEVYFLGALDNGFKNKFHSHPVVKLISVLSKNDSDLLNLRYSDNYEPSETLEYCFNLLQDDQGGVFYTDIQSFKQYYKEYLSMRITPNFRRQIALLIESYRNEEIYLANVINKINKLLDISITENQIDYVTLSDCLSLLETEDDRYKQDINYISLMFKKNIRKELSTECLVILLPQFRKYAESKIKFEELLDACTKCLYLDNLNTRKD